ncbi:Puf6p NDAI_0A07100 [Naumovozyma dairenensis CBS 421]|uniref:PUM-HD domain-containing protein n=1 Tax=Naumovozyma dairenensis (strain ATCC 10597 / BCRC 20456 / CBS 421 / NBRC 0211 / NRRL Y-12639) TaxID=1071378 RepID=G0W4X6_NAUDC|nr:hypothetical protein NDAI_0A07100 [Naumovozyma dairenensis CBS 421]CCD22864.1 hypothetical protein NDAI_0A07100 [Naumovozyma dairenensis CBS 421]
MAPTTTKKFNNKSNNNKKRSSPSNEKSINKKAKISVESSSSDEDEDELDQLDDDSASSGSGSASESSSDDDDADELDDIVSSASDVNEDDLDHLDNNEEESNDDEEGEDQDKEDEDGERTEDGEKSTSDNHTEQRKLLKERKMQRKSGIEVQHIKSLWEKLRVNTPPLPKEVREKLSNEIWELSKNCISDLVMKHDASRVVQTLVKYSTKARREQIINSLKGKYYVLATSAYGKYLLVKLLHYGSKNSRQVIINELHGCLRKLMRHREGAYVVEDLYVLYATQEQRQQMVREFWGAEYAAFREKHSGTTIEQVCESSIEKRNIISRNLIGTITASVEKGSTGFQILHAAMKEFVKIADDKEISEMIELLHEQFAELVHTPEGSEVACTLIAKANAKERKLLVRALKDHTEKLIKNEHGNIVFITLLLCVDDTVLIFKSFGPSVKEHLQDFIIDKYGRRPWIYILLGLNGKYFAPNVKKELSKYLAMAELTSKKPTSQKRQELLNKFSPMYLKTISKYYSEILSENLGSQFISEVLINDELYEQLGEKDKAVFVQIIDRIITSFKGDISEESHPIHRPYSTRLLKSLIQGGKWNNKDKKLEPLEKVEGLGVPFAKRFYEDIIDSSNLLEWINTSDSSFTVVALYEALNDKEEGDQLIGDLEEIKGRIDATKDENNKGAQLLLKLLK